MNRTLPMFHLLLLALAGPAGGTPAATGGGSEAVARAEAQVARLNQLTDSIRRQVEASQPIADTDALRREKPAPPPPPPSPAVAETNAPPPPPPPVEIPLILRGVMMHAGRPTAVINDQVVGVGGSIDGHRVLSIGRSQVRVVSTAGVEKVLFVYKDVRTHEPAPP